MIIEDHHFIKNRRNNSLIYRADTFAHYMKIGDAKTIEHEVKLYNSIKKFGFPLPNIIEYNIESDSLSRMKEESLIGDLYSDIFTQNCEKGGVISNNNFLNFCNHQKNHLNLQSKTINQDITGESFDKIINKLSEENILEDKYIVGLIDFVKQNTNDLPSVRNHGDHNPYNIFVDGIIDLEDSFDGPIGYDTITSLTQNFWFPISDGEYTQQHRFTIDQINIYKNQTNYFNIYDNNIFAALFFMRAVFVTVGSENTRILKKFRYQKLKIAIDEIIFGKKQAIDFFIDNYKTN